VPEVANDEQKQEKEKNLACCKVATHYEPNGAKSEGGEQRGRIDQKTQRRYPGSYEEGALAGNKLSYTARGSQYRNPAYNYSAQGEPQTTYSE